VPSPGQLVFAALYLLLLLLGLLQGILGGPLGLLCVGGRGGGWWCVAHCVVGDESAFVCSRMIDTGRPNLPSGAR
jgi:hypothetical protein